MDAHTNSKLNMQTSSQAAFLENSTLAGPQKGIYLDYAAATPLDADALNAMLTYLTCDFYNPSAPYAPARAVKSQIEKARTQLAQLIGGRSAQITFTAGATEANNLAFKSVSGHVVTPATEHDSVLSLARSRSHTFCAVREDGIVTPAALRAALTPATELVSISYANGELGCIQPLRELSQVVAAERTRRLEAGELTPLYFHTDASQAAGYKTLQVSSLGVDLMTLSAQKVYGPKQVGLLWSSDAVALKPLVMGGGQEGGLRSGTQNVAGIIAFAVALAKAQELRASEAKRLLSLRDYLQARLLDAFPFAYVAGPRDKKLRLPGLLTISFPGLEARRLVLLLEEHGIFVGTGSACAASKMKVSPALMAVGVPDEVAQGSLRISLGRTTTKDQVDKAADVICKVIAGELERTDNVAVNPQSNINR